MGEGRGYRMEKNLFINDTPAVKVYQYNAFAMSIAEQHVDFEKWLINNYIQLCLGYHREHRGISIDFVGGTIFDSVELLNYEDTDEKKDYYACDDERIISFIIDSIQDDKYICTKLNEFYVPERFSYRKTDFEHDALIYGYSQENRTVHIIGFNDRRNYRKGVVSFEEFCRAFKTKDPLLKRIWVNENPYCFSIEKMKRMLSDYVYSADCRERLEDYIDVTIEERSFFRQKCNGYPPLCFGSNIFDEVINYTNHIKEEQARFDYRCVYSIYEHKELMLRRLMLLEKFIDINYEDEKNVYRRLVYEGKLLVSLALKYRLSKKQENLDFMIKTVQNMQELEKECLLRVLANDNKKL